MPHQRAVLSALGPDRPGIVDRISAILHEAGANIEDSRMAILGGEFALVLLFSGRPGAVARVRKGVGAASRRLGLSFTLKPTRARRRPAPFLTFRLRVTGLDQPGIVHSVSAALAALGVNVASLDTRLTEAPESGAPIFALSADLQVPVALPAGDLRAALERACRPENLDFALEASGVPPQ